MRMTTAWQRLIAMSLTEVGFAIFLLAAGGDRPALVDAAKNSDRDALRALLQKKVDVNAADADGSTALLWVSYRDDLEAAELLIRAGAKVNAASRKPRNSAASNCRRWSSLRARHRSSKITWP